MGAYHYVNDLASFYQLIEKSKTTLREKVPNQLEKLVRQAKFTNTTETQIINLLKGNLTTLDGDVSKMLEIVGKD